jgi:hypothetical protein
MRRRFLKRLALITSVVTLSLGASPSLAAATVTIGQLPPSTPPASCAGNNYDYLTTTVSAGAPYVSPGDGTIVSWTTRAASGTLQQLTMKVFRLIGPGDTYQVIAHDGPRGLTQSVDNTFATSMPVQAGDVVGVNTPVGTSTHNVSCAFISTPPSGNILLFHQPGLADGGSAMFGGPEFNTRNNVRAELDPSNAFTLGGVDRNKKKGTATLTVTVPNPGELTGSGQGVKVASTGGAVISKSVAAGPAQLLIKAKGKKKRKLNETGKVKVNPTITYTPTGGNPSIQSTKVKLKKKL